MWSVLNKAKHILGPGKQQRSKDNSGYENVEQDAFIVGDEFDDDDDKDEDIELK
jgi:hypothetical protein